MNDKIQNVEIDKLMRIAEEFEKYSNNLKSLKGVKEAILLLKPFHKKIRETERNMTLLAKDKSKTLKKKNGKI